MATIPLEDSFSDVLAKAQRGLKLKDEELAAQAGIALEQLTAAKQGEVNDAVLRKLAGALKLGPQSLLDSAHKAWLPAPITLDGLAQFNTTFDDMTVNCFLAWDPAGKQAAVFDTGADATPVLEFVRQKGLAVSLILLTHTHPDHIADLERLKRETGAPAWVGELEKFSGAQPFSEGKAFQVGSLRIETRQTSGHAIGGITFVISGLSRPVAVVGDALFASSMGGGLISYSDALENNRRKIFNLANETVVAPGHGPLTTVGEEKAHNPFYPEFQKS